MPDGIIQMSFMPIPFTEPQPRTNRSEHSFARKIQAGFWVVATDQRARMSFYDFDFKSKTVVIFGNESKGVSPLLKKNADQLLAIPHSPAVESFNVSAAAAIILFEAWKQKKIACGQD